MADYSYGYHYNPGYLYPFNNGEVFSGLGYVDQHIVSDWDPTPHGHYPTMAVALASYQPGETYGKASLTIFVAQCLTCKYLELVAEAIPQENRFPEVCLQPQHEHAEYRKRLYSPR